ncbi:hypothetical protein U1Q18_048688, partial [Sarracenia purpurea var. burkii]
MDLFLGKNIAVLRPWLRDCSQTRDNISRNAARNTTQADILEDADSTAACSTKVYIAK